MPQRAQLLLSCLIVERVKFVFGILCPEVKPRSLTHGGST